MRRQHRGPARAGVCVAIVALVGFSGCSGDDQDAAPPEEQKAGPTVSDDDLEKIGDSLTAGDADELAAAIGATGDVTLERKLVKALAGADIAFDEDTISLDETHAYAEADVTIDGRTERWQVSFLWDGKTWVLARTEPAS